jgi:hypothetical protein
VRLECCTHAQHIGEAQPIRADGICEHPFLVPNSARTECILPGRIDIGRHYILSGGTEGLKEEYESLVSRVQSFGVYLWDLQAHPRSGLDHLGLELLMRAACLVMMAPPA